MATPTGSQLQVALDLSGGATIFAGDVEKTVQIFPPPVAGEPSCVDHPVLLNSFDEDLRQVCGTPGSALVTYRLGLITVSPDFPDVVVSHAGTTLKANVAPFDVYFRGGFAQGLSASGNLVPLPLLEEGCNDTFASNWTQTATVNPLVLSFEASGGDKAGGLEDALSESFSRSAEGQLVLESGFEAGAAGMVLRAPESIEVTAITAIGSSAAAVQLGGTVADANAGIPLFINTTGMASTASTTGTAGIRVNFKILQESGGGALAFKASDNRLTGSTEIRFTEVSAETKPFGDYNLTQQAKPNASIAVTWQAVDSGLSLVATGGNAINNLVTSTFSFRLTDYLNFTDLQAEISMPSGYTIDPGAFTVSMSCQDEQPNEINGLDFTLANGYLALSPAPQQIGNTSQFAALNKTIIGTLEVGAAIQKALNESGYVVPPRLDGATCQLQWTSTINEFDSNGIRLEHGIALPQSALLRYTACDPANFSMNSSYSEPWEPFYAQCSTFRAGTSSAGASLSLPVGI